MSGIDELAGRHVGSSGEDGGNDGGSGGGGSDGDAKAV